jgi:hypothetical protein
MKPLIALIAAALLMSGCGAAAAQGGPASSSPSTSGDVAVSHDVDPNEPPAPGGATLVTPVPGDSRGFPVLPVRLRVWNGDDGHAWARVTWWGGIPDCYALRPVRIARHGTTIRLSLLEASAVPADTVCIDIAMEKAVKVDLGELEPGSYTVRAGTLKRTLVVDA